MFKYDYQKLFGLKFKLTTRAILEEILKFEKNGKAQVDQDTIGKAIGVCRFTINRHIRMLENIKIKGMPFVVRCNKRKKDGTYEVTTYFFPWIRDIGIYQKEDAEQIVRQLIDEFRTEALSDKPEDVHVANNSNNRSEVSILSIKEKVQKISNHLQLNKFDVMKVLIQIGESIRNCTYIWHIDRYILKAFHNAGIKHLTEESLAGIHKYLFKDNEQYFINIDSYIADLLA